MSQQSSGELFTKGRAGDVDGSHLGKLTFKYQQTHTSRIRCSISEHFKQTSAYFTAVTPAIWLALCRWQGDKYSVTFLLSLFTPP